MALDNGKETRRPHSQEDAEKRQRELEDKIVNDKDMGNKLMDHAMRPQRMIRSDELVMPDEAFRRGGAGSDISGIGTARAAHSDGSSIQRNREKATANTGKDVSRSYTDQSRSSDINGGIQRNGIRQPGSYQRSDNHGISGDNSVFGRDAKKDTKKDNKPSVITLNNTAEVEHDIEFAKRMRDKKKKAVRTKFILMAVVEILTLICIFGFGSVYRYMNMTQAVEFDVSKVQNNNIDITQKQKMSGYWTVAVFGVDSRDGGVGRGANADVQIICNVDMATGDITLVSVYRDTYLKTGSSNRYAKINEAYAVGGPEQAVAALNSNLDLNIENYVTFNWKAVADTIDMLGGVDIDITDKEFYYMNAYIHETSVKAGINEKNPAANYIKKAGPQHLTGVQAVAYARLRYMDSDFERTRRQREVISQCLDNAKKADLATLTSVIDTVLPQVAFNIDAADIVELAKGISRYNIRESAGFPKDIKDQMMGKKGDCVIPVTLTSNVKWLHSVLFGDEDYKVSNAVETYSQKIADDSGYYASHKEEVTSSKKESSSKDESDETDDSESGSGKKSTKETDKDGYVITGTDEDGNNIYQTDADGNKVKASDKSKTKTEKSETEEGEDTDEDEEIEETEEETDEDGNVIETSKSTKESTTEHGPAVVESDSDTKKKGAKASDKETTAEDETTKASSDKETSSGEVIEPGLIEEDDDSGAGPSGGGNSSSEAAGPGAVTDIEQIEIGPAVGPA